MTADRQIAIASAIIVGAGILWGFYWLPVRWLAGNGLPGAWGTLAITFAAAFVLLPGVLRRAAHLRSADRIAALSLALGGAAFALYSIGFNYGRVAIIILLWFLTPVWSVMIARFLLGWPTPRLRILAIAIGLSGLAFMLGADGQIPLPEGVGEWMALAAGIIWSIATTGIRTRPEIPPREAAFVFALGAAAASLLAAPFLAPLPSEAGAGIVAILAVAFLTGALWWAVSTAAIAWAAARLEPARVGILLMSEVLVGAASAAVIAGEHLSPQEVAGGALVLLAGLLEVWPVGRSSRRGG